MIRRAWSLIALFVILAGVPVFLWHATGSPGTEGLPDLEGLKRAIDLRWVPLQWAIAILALVAWMLWAYLALVVLVRIAGHFERRFRAAGRMWAASEAFAWSPVKVMVDVVLGAAFVTSTVTNGSARAAASQQYSGWSTVIAPHVAAIRSRDAASQTERSALSNATQRHRGLIGHDAVRILVPSGLMRFGREILSGVSPRRSSMTHTDGPRYGGSTVDARSVTMNAW
jgi:hypothetical protein